MLTTSAAPLKTALATLTSCRHHRRDQGTDEILVPLSDHVTEAKIGRAVADADIISLNHFAPREHGHRWCDQNLGMGCASRAGRDGAAQ